MSFLPFDAPAELLPRRIFALVKCGRAYRVPYTEAVWRDLLGSGEYDAGFFGLLTRFLLALRGAEWPAGNYFPGGWYRVLKAQGQDMAHVPVAPASLGSFYGDEVRVDAAGGWTVGRKAITGAVLQFFLRNLHFDETLQRYLIRYDLPTHEETRYLHHESLPLRIVALDERPDGHWVRGNDGTVEPLRWDTLRLDRAERLFCAIRPQSLPAQFSDGPRFRLLDRLEERDGGWAAPDAGAIRPLRLDAPWPGAGSLTPPPANPLLPGESAGP